MYVLNALAENPVLLAAVIIAFYAGAESVTTTVMAASGSSHALIKTSLTTEGSRR